MRDGARRSLLTLGAGLALLTTAGAGNVPAALAASRNALGPALARAGSGPGQAGQLVPPGASRSVSPVVAVADLARSSRTPAITPLHRLLQAALLVVAPTPLPPGTPAALPPTPRVPP